MAAIVDDAGESAVLVRGVHIRLHVVQKQVRADDRNQRAVHIDRHGAHHTKLTREHIRGDVGKVQLAALNRAPVPIPLMDRYGSNLSFPVQFAGGVVVHQQHHTFRQGDVAGIHLRVGIERQHYLGKVCDQAELLGDVRVGQIDTFLRQQLHARGPVQRGIRQLCGRSVHRGYLA